MAVFFTWFFRFILATEGFDTGVEPMGEEVLNLVGLIYAVMGAFYALLGVLGIVGGIYSLKRRLWGLALAGAIASTVVFLPFGVVAVVFTSLGRKDFSPGTASNADRPTTIGA
jgi:hypothetical protein